MSLKLRENSKYALAVPTSMGVRITPEGCAPAHVSNSYHMQVTSAETNVASVSSYLGLPAKALTTFVKGSPVAALIKSDLKSRNIDYEGPDVEQGGPWGYRHQFNIADSGYGMRGPRVHNDRAGEVGLTLNAKDFDLERIFGEEGVQIVHSSGLFAALSPETGKFFLDVAEAAKKHGTLVSFDMNYRASFWKNREKELGELFRRIASVSDILVGNEEDFQLALGIEGPESGGTDLGSKTDSFKILIDNVKEAYPNASVFATTLRQVVDANLHLWGAIVREEDEWHVIRPREIGVLDRIGGGDAFVGGLLYGILKGWEPDKWGKFGWACGALTVTSLKDYCQPADEEQVWSAWEGNARVKR